jgi:hypothetical protein
LLRGYLLAYLREGLALGAGHLQSNVGWVDHGYLHMMTWQMTKIVNAASGIAITSLHRACGRH